MGKIWIVCWLCLCLTSALSFADNINEAIRVYNDSIIANQKRMTWFIPFRSLADPRITDGFYNCGKGSWEPNCSNNDECCTKSFLFPVFYVALPILHVSAEIAATPTVRLCGLPYLCYLAYKNHQAEEMIAFLGEVEKYLLYKGKNDEEIKTSYYLNSTFLKPAYDEYKSSIDAHVRVSHFADHIKANIETNQYRFNNDLWSISDFIHAAQVVDNDDNSFSMDNESIEDPESATCTVCEDNKPTGAFVPCGHLVTCDECYEQIKSQAQDKTPKCPKCRAVIEKKIKIYQ